MKRIIHLAAALIVMLILAAAAARVSAATLREETGAKTVTGATYDFIDGHLTIYTDETTAENAKEGCFEKYENIETVELKNGVTAIRSNSFKNCTGLKNVIISSTVTTIGESAFEECTALEEVVFSEGLERIEKNAFSQCSSLKSVCFPSTLTSIGNKSFKSCTSLKSVTFLSSSVTMNDKATLATFYNVGSLESPVYLSYPNWTGTPMTEREKWYGGYFTFTPPEQESTPGNTHQFSGTRTASTAEKDIIHYQLSCGVQNTDYAVCGAGCNIYRGEAVGTDPALITNDTLADAANPANAFSVYYDIDINTDYTNELTVLFWYTIRHLGTGETTQIFVNSGVSPATTR